MIVSPDPEGLAIVLQVDHQDQCALAARAWGNTRFARPEPWEEIVEAARVHDEGWRAWEQAPEIAATGRPVDFPELPRERHVALYRDGIDRAAAGDPRVGLLVSMHGLGLYQSRLGLDGAPPAELAPVAASFVAAERERQRSLLEAIGGGDALRAWAWAGYRLLQAWDTLSLYLTWDRLARGLAGRLAAVPRHIVDPGVDLTLSPVGMRLAACDPFPFTGDEVALPVATRTVEDRPYASHDELRAALAASPVETRRYRLVRAG